MCGADVRIRAIRVYRVAKFDSHSRAFVRC